VLRQARKDMQRIERELDRLAGREADLHERMAAGATDHALLRELGAEQDAIGAHRERLEGEWMAAAEIAGE